MFILSGLDEVKERKKEKRKAYIHLLANHISFLCESWSYNFSLRSKKPKEEEKKRMVKINSVNSLK